MNALFQRKISFRSYGMDLCVCPARPWPTGLHKTASEALQTFAHRRVFDLGDEDSVTQRMRSCDLHLQRLVISINP
jgi:hypothetical protein